MDRVQILFENAVSTSSQKTYARNLEKFMIFIGFENRYGDFIRLSTDEIQTHLENYVLDLRTLNLKATTIHHYLNPIILFLEVNKILFHKRALRMLVPKNTDKIGNELPFTDEDIQKMLEITTSKRNKALIFFFASTGARPAVLVDPILRFKHIYQMPFGCKAILMYAGSHVEYWAFLTPEASNALEVYRDERIRKGEKITSESFVFTVQRESSRWVKEDYLTLPAFYSVFNIIEKKAGIDKIKIGNRYDKAIIYGFRKRFNTTLKLENSVNFNIAEKLMAHKRGLDGVYFKPTREDCFKEFLKAVPKITINEAEKTQTEIERV